MCEWLPDGTGVQRDVEDGGDDQRGATYSVRFHREGMPGASITQTAYGVNLGVDEREGPFGVRVDTVWMVYRDPADPGGSEVWSSPPDSRTEVRQYETKEEAEAAARQVANELSANSGAHTWDGLPDS
jgi:hypothetical protein